MRCALILTLCLLCGANAQQPNAGFVASFFKPAAAGGGGGITLVNSIAKAGNASECTTNMDTSGVTLLVACVGQYDATGNPVTWADGQSNTWLDGTKALGSGGQGTHIYYVANPTVNANHTFTASGGNGTQYTGFRVYGFSGGTWTYDGGKTNNSGNFTALNPGAITTQLSVTMLASGDIGQTAEVDSGFSVEAQLAPSGGLDFFYTGYKIDSSATSHDPAWNKTSGGVMGGAAAHAAFR